ncbi:MAG: flagellar motor protein MotA, partial [Rhodospirillales bacterium]
MTQPRKYLFRMIVFVIAVVALCGMLFGPLRDAFVTNAPLNGLILGVLVLGIIYNFRQVAMLYPEVSWIETFRQNTAPLSEARPPRLLAPMATMVGEHKDRLSLSTLAMRSLLDGIVSRLDESRDISRYTIGLLIFLGLLGTFWGLLQTVASIGDVIGGLSVEGGDTARVFGDLKRGLQAPMAGMGTAFSSSLFGLAGSLVLGFLDLQANQAQNRFYNELEDWLSTVTRLA